MKIKVKREGLEDEVIQVHGPLAGLVGTLIAVVYVVLALAGLAIAAVAGTVVVAASPIFLITYLMVKSRMRKGKL